MDRYARGDDTAFTVVHAELGTRLRPFLLRLCGSLSQADDLLQETFLRLHRGRGSFAPQAAALPWAYAIARNVWLEQARSGAMRAGRRGDSLDRAHQSPALAAGPEVDSEQTLIAREMAARIERALGTLPEHQREAFVLLRYEGLSVKEAASVAGTTQTALKLRAFRAYDALRTALAEPATEGGPDVPAR